MIRWICVVGKGRINNDFIRGRVEVAPTVDQMRENGLGGSVLREEVTRRQ